MFRSGVLCGPQSRLLCSNAATNHPDEGPGLPAPCCRPPHPLGCRQAGRCVRVVTR